MSEIKVQSTCCRHASPFQCATAADACPMGYRSHALPDEDGYEHECECGAVLLTTEVWKNCSGRRHVYINGAAVCSCRQKRGSESPHG
mgnify:FL=1